MLQSATTLGQSTMAQSTNAYRIDTIDPPAIVDTLVGALSSLDELNKRLEDTRAETYKIAEAIGGPYPVSEPKCQPIASPSAMSRLNRAVGSAHQTVSELESALSAIRRALGA